MTGMEYAIEQAARSLYGHRQSVGDFPDGLTDWDDLPDPWCDEWREAGEHVVRALAEAGWLAPAPLTEEWAVGKSWEDPSLGWVAHDPSDEWLAREQAHGIARPLLRRYVTEFLPVDRAEGDGRADRPSWVDEHGINHADGDGDRW